MNKKMKIILGVIIAIVIVGAVIIIFPNYKNEVTDDSVVVSNENSDLVYATVTNLRIERDIDVYSKEASAIVIGSFTKKGDVVWNSDKTDISTETYFKIDKVLKGDIKPGEEIKILQWGGQIDGQVKTYEGAIKYDTNKTYLLYLGKNEDGEWDVFSGDWGQFLVDDNNMVNDFNDSLVSLSAFTDQIDEYIK